MFEVQGNISLMRVNHKALGIDMSIIFSVPLGYLHMKSRTLLLAGGWWCLDLLPWALSASGAAELAPGQRRGVRSSKAGIQLSL